MLSETVQSFLHEYTEAFVRHSQTANHLEEWAASQLEDHLYYLHAISARAKTPQSLRTKLIQKQIVNPAIDVKDLLGLRIITYYSEEVDHIASRLRERMTVDEKHSLDKRQKLADERSSATGLCNWWVSCRDPRASSTTHCEA